MQHCNSILCNTVNPFSTNYCCKGQCLTKHYIQCLQVTRLDIMTCKVGAIPVIADDHLIFFRGLCGYAWINTPTLLSPMVTKRVLSSFVSFSIYFSTCLIVDLLYAKVSLPYVYSVVDLRITKSSYLMFITSLAKEVMFLVVLVCLFVCLFVCGQHYSKSYEWIGIKFYGRLLSSTRKNWLNFGGDLGIVRWVNKQKYTVIVVAYPDRGEGNDPELFFFFFFF